MNFRDNNNNNHNRNRNRREYNYMAEQDSFDEAYQSRLPFGGGSADGFGVVLGGTVTYGGGEAGPRRRRRSQEEEKEVPSEDDPFDVTHLKIYTRPPLRRGRCADR